MNELALFAGAGGGILGGKLLGWRTMCAVEHDQYAASVLAQRQNDGTLEAFPIWDDVRTFDGKPWRGRVDVVSGGFPCQDISCAGRGEGLEGARSGLWVEMARIIREVRPKYVFVENSPMLTSRGLGTVLGDLAAMGFNAEWGVLGAHHAGAPHKRDRIWILAHFNSVSTSAKVADAADTNAPARAGADAGGWSGRQPRGGGGRGGIEDKVAYSNSFRRGDDGENSSDSDRDRNDAGSEHGWWRAEPPVGRVADGVAYRVDRLKALGNGQVPAVAALAFTTLMRRIEIRGQNER